MLCMNGNMCVCVRYDRIERNDGNCMGVANSLYVPFLCVRCESCLCFAEMLIYFRFGEFRANCICPIFREGHAEFLYDFDACMRAWL